MKTCIYDKTDKGREEIATRKYQLPARLRTLLLLIDGRHSVEALLDKLSTVGVGAQQVDELLSEQYITLVAGGPAAAVVAQAPRVPASARARMLARTRELAERKRLASAALAE